MQHTKFCHSSFVYKVIQTPQKRFCLWCKLKFQSSYFSHLMQRCLLYFKGRVILFYGYNVLLSLHIHMLYNKMGPMLQLSIICRFSPSCQNTSITNCRKLAVQSEGYKQFKHICANSPGIQFNFGLCNPRKSNRFYNIFLSPVDCASKKPYARSSLASYHCSSLLCLLFATIMSPYVFVCM